jgi:ubiquitin carboxyl-terminal hydrolase 7
LRSICIGHLKPPRSYHLYRQPYVAHTSTHLSRFLIASFSDAHHRFIAEECDWGFTRFSELRKLFHPQPGHTRPTIEEDSAVVSVYVRVLEDPTGVLWHNFVK